EVDGEPRPLTTDARQEAWLAWAEEAAIDVSLRQALENTVLRGLLQPLSRNAVRALFSDDISTCGTCNRDSTVHGKARLARLTRQFSSQILNGCREMSNSAVGSAGCTVRFCRDNPVYANRLKAMRGFSVDMLAMELARRAAERPNCVELQPHTFDVHRPLSVPAVVPEVPSDLIKASSPVRDGPFGYTFARCMQRLLGFADHDQLEDDGAHPKHCAQQWVPARRLLDSAVRPEALDGAQKLGTTQHASRMSSIGKVLPTGPSPLVCSTRREDQHQMYQPDAALLAGLAAAVPDALRTCDDSTNPALGVSRLNAQSSSLVAAIGGRLLRNTIALTMSSPRELSRCFAPDCASLDGGQTELRIDMTAAIGFFDCVFGSASADRMLLLSTACRALNTCLPAIESVLARTSVPYDAVESSVTRTLAIAVLFLGSAAACAENGHVPTAVEKLQSRVARLMVRHVYGCTDSTTENTRAQQSSRLGWYATFARDSELRRQWVRWWARVPAPVTRRWIEAMKADAHDSVSCLFGGLATDATVASRITKEPVRWAGSLEMLRLMHEAAQQLHDHQLGISHSVELPGDDNYVDIDEFVCKPLVSRFDLRKELQRWTDNMRQRASTQSSTISENIFSIFQYPFVFGLHDKLTLHSLESYESMRQRYLGAHVRQDELSRSKQMLNIDLHAEHLVRPGVQPNWPLLASNHLAISRATLQFLVLSVRRSRLVQDSMDILSTSLDHIRFPMKVRFVAGGEDGYDLGGLQKELLTLLLPMLLSPDRGLFAFANDNVGAGHTRGADFLWPNAASPHSLRDFELVGALLGVAFANDLAMDFSLAPLLVSQLAYDGGYSAATIARCPLEALMLRVGRVFPALVDGLQKLLDWDESTQGLIEDVFCRSFSVTVSDPLHIWQQRRNDALCSKSRARNGLSSTDIPLRLLAPFAHLPLPQSDNNSNPSETITFALSGDGSMEVTGANRRAYVRRYLEFIAFEHARAQIDALQRGFERAANGITYRMFRSDELEYLFYAFGNSAPIDVNELERITTYEEYSTSDLTVQMFWRIVRGFSQEQLRQLLTFVTASDRIPLAGYGGISFVIQRNGSDIDRLPTATTCFNRLLLPTYGSESKMRSLLLISIENTLGFGLL
ncbi:hypothetical protein H4R24_005724, partial [Coemansia sp. RSA 988]